jgi:hypothetical protein
MVGTTAYVADGSDGLLIIDVGDFTSFVFWDDFESGDTSAWWAAPP